MDKIDPALARQAIPIGKATRHPKNYRRGDVGAIARSLEQFGQVRPILVQKSTGFIVAGNHTYSAAVQLGWTHIAATQVDMSDAKADAYLVADNRLSDLASNDDEALIAVLRDLDKDDLSAAGYVDADLDAMIASLEGAPGREPAPTEAPMNPGQPVISYTIIFDTQTQQHAFYDWLRYLKEADPDSPTVAARIVAHIDEVLSAG